jgi:hypothetical protein
LPVEKLQREKFRMPLLATSASGINGAGYGKLLAFGESGQLLGPFTEDTRVSDPRGLGVDDGLLFLNSGSDRILALDRNGRSHRASVQAAKAATRFWRSVRNDKFSNRGRCMILSSARSISPLRRTEQWS